MDTAMGSAPMSSEDLETAKEERRATVRAARRNRSEPKSRPAEVALADVVCSIDEVAAASCVAVYVSQASEPATGELLHRLHERGVRVLLPVLGEGLKRGWAEYAGHADLKVRAPSRPPEPSLPDLGADALADAEVVIVPALAVDTAGTRLGQGGGWYDRALLTADRRALVLALVHDGELVDATEAALPRGPHDRPVDAVATPSGWERLSQAARTKRYD